MTTLDSTSQNGTQSQPSDEGSENGNGQPGSKTVTITREEFDSLKNQVERIGSDTQSNKDRAVKKTNERLEKLEGDVKPLLERAAIHIAEGKTPAEAMAIVNSEQEADEDKLVMRELLQAIKGGTLPKANSSGNGNATSVNLAEIIKNNDLDGNDPEVIEEILTKQWASPVEAENAALKLAIRRAKPTPPNLSAASSFTGSTPVTSDNADAIYAEIAELSKNYTKNSERIKALQKRVGG